MTPPVLFRDNRFVILDKPAGLPVHPGPRGGASVEDCFAELSPRRDGPWLAHRLDADTSGCLVVALRRAALHAAQGEFAAGRAEKIYWAIVTGGPRADRGEVDAALAKQVARTGWKMTVDPAGQRAVTSWRVRGRGGNVCWMELRPRTGRTHQVRVHCAVLGCPIVGDPVYGAGPSDVPRPPLHLLARSIRLNLQPEVAATAPPPPHMRMALRDLGWDGG